MAWFINDPTVIKILQAVLTAAGPNFNIPYNSTSQPPNAPSMLADDLLQFQFVGGSQLQSIAYTGEVSSMGKAISGLLAIISPLISSYVMILPILGIIRGIIEIICAMMNPFAVIAAVIRLFEKWIPPFISLFPPFAAVLMIINLIKILLAVAFFLITVIVPIFELIKQNVQNLKQLLGSNGNPGAIAAEKAKLQALVIEILNQTGILNVIKPILEIIMSILSLSSGIPCNSSNSDSTCCGDTVCPPVLLNPPQGQAIILPTIYSGAPQSFAWKITTLPPGNSNLYKIIPFIQNITQQLNSQLNEPVSQAQPAGGSGNTATINIKITSRRGTVETTSVVSIDGNDIIVIDPNLASMVGLVQYTIVPNFDVLVANNIIGLGCHPSISAAKSSLSNYGDPSISGLEKFPEIGNIGLDNLIVSMGDLVDDIRDFTQPPFPPVDDDPAQILNAFINNLKNILNSILSRLDNSINSEITVDKSLVRSGGEDKAVISVIPRDSTGSLIAKQLPNGVGIGVQIFTDFGEISNKVLNSSTGIITADLTAESSGTASLTAKINNNYISKINNNVSEIQRVSVRFISDAILPKRRLVSKQNSSDTAKSTNNNTIDREPGASNG